MHLYTDEQGELERQFDEVVTTGIYFCDRKKDP